MEYGNSDEALRERLKEIERVLFAHQSAIDHLKYSNSFSAITPIMIETLVGLGLTALRETPQGDFDSKLTPEFESRAAQLIRFNDRILQALEWQGARRMKSSDPSNVMTIARAAGEWACFHHPGRFVSIALEEALNLAGRQLLTTSKDFQPTGKLTRVVHVMTTASAVGGHTRLVDRWARFDAQREHSVVLTEQGDELVPSWLSENVSGRVALLRSEGDSEKVSELSEILKKYDVIVLHIHPYDVVAVAACADPRKRPPTIFVNHADHLFWFGVGSSDIILDLRPRARDFTVRKRGVDVSRTFTLPIPLDQPYRNATRTDAKQAIGVPKNALLLLTIASSWKYAPYAGIGFVDLIAKVLESVPLAQLVAIGPNPLSESWAALRNRYPNRVKILGPTPHTHSFLEAADIYLDSVPIGAMTSVLEAALFDTPAVTLSIQGVDDLGPTGFGGDSLLRYSSGTEWQDGVIRLLNDSNFRSEEGRRISDAIRQEHFRDQWSLRLENVYSLAAHQAQIPAGIDSAVFEPIDCTMAAINSFSNEGRSPETLLAASGLLPRILT